MGILWQLRNKPWENLQKLSWRMVAAAMRLWAVRSKLVLMSFMAPAIEALSWMMRYALRVVMFVCCCMRTRYCLTGPRN